MVGAADPEALGGAEHAGAEGQLRPQRLPPPRAVNVNVAAVTGQELVLHECALGDVMEPGHQPAGATSDGGRGGERGAASGARVERAQLLLHSGCAEGGAAGSPGTAADAQLRLELDLQPDRNRAVFKVRGASDCCSLRRCRV